MTRVALISDQHFDASSRFGECCRVLDWIAQDARQRGVDVIALGGDLFERRPLPVETKAAAEWIIELAAFAPVIGVYGNHDVAESLALFNKLETENRVVFLERPDTVSVAGVTFACMPWPSKAGLAAMYPHLTRDELNSTAVTMLQSILRGMGDELDARDEACGPEPRFFLGHCQVRASRVSTGQPLMGCDFELGVEDLALVRAHFYGLGHIHLGVGNEWDIAGAPAAYPGSPRRTSFGELEDKGYIIVEFDGPRLVGWERIKTPCAGMLHLTGEFVNAGLYEGCEGPSGIVLHDRDVDVSGAECRLRYHVEAQDRAAATLDEARIERVLLDRGALSVKIEPEVVTTKRARAPEVARATTIGEKLTAHWESIGFDPGERRASLLEKAAQLEEEARNG